MKRLHRITENRFSIRLYMVAVAYGFKTVGNMEKALKKAQPHTKWQSGGTYVRSVTLLKEINEYSLT